MRDTAFEDVSPYVSCCHGNSTLKETVKFMVENMPQVKPKEQQRIYNKGWRSSHNQ